MAIDLIEKSLIVDRYVQRTWVLRRSSTPESAVPLITTDSNPVRYNSLMSRLGHITRLIGAILLIAGATSLASRAAAQYQPVDPFEAAVRHLRKATVRQPGGMHLLMLSSLRQLRDPALAPLFRSLTSNADSSIGVHAVLGLAELDEKKLVDPWLIRQLKGSESRTVVIRLALDGELIKPEGMQELLAWDDLEPLPRLWFLAKLINDEKLFDRAALARLAESPDLEIAGISAWLMAQTGDDSALSAYQARVEGLSSGARNSHLRETFAAIYEYRVSKALPWLAQELKQPDLPPEVAYEGVHTLLTLDVEQGVRQWKRLLGDKPSYTQTVRYAELLLSAGATVPASAYKSLPTGEPLVDRLTAVGKAMSDKGDIAGALIELINLGHTRTARWALLQAAKLPDADAARVYEHVINRVEGERRGIDERGDLAVNATARLFQIAPDRVIELLAKTPDDSLAQETMLMGLLMSDSPRAAEAAARVRRIGFNRPDSIATILIAKHETKLSPDDLASLTQLAKGGGKISDPLQAQVAWLYLRHTSQVDRALALLLKDQ